MIPKLALSTSPEDRHLLWMSRPFGTYTLRERDTYLEGTFEHNTWKFYHEQTKDPILAYALSLDGMQDGKVMGTIYAELQKQIVNYTKTRAVYVEYRKAGYSKKFRSAHEAEIILHQAAKKYFDELGITKLPSIKGLREEYASLLEQKRKAYSAYKQARAEMKELHNVRANVEYLLEIHTGSEMPRNTQHVRR